MALLIDGYNLLHAAGILAPHAGPASLERSRRALLNILAESLPEAEQARTVVVFDAAGAPPGLPHSVQHGAIEVRYSRGYPDADTLIEELILRESAPRSLTVVSSDHRIQRAARRRKARAKDSDRWYAGLMRRRAHGARGKGPRSDAKPQAPDPWEVEAWVREFSEAGGEELSVEFTTSDKRLFEKSEARPTGPENAAEQENPGEEANPDAATAEREGADGDSTVRKRPASRPPTPKSGDSHSPHEESKLPRERRALDSNDPFPPGYGEDLLEGNL
jgi:predicted RNA-binding protein with PIN domain